MKNKHDGAIMAFPKTLNPYGVQAHIQKQVRTLVEREWEVGPGVRMAFPATWSVREE